MECEHEMRAVLLKLCLTFSKILKQVAIKSLELCTEKYE